MLDMIHGHALRHGRSRDPQLQCSSPHELWRAFPQGRLRPGSAKWRRRQPPMCEGLARSRAGATTHLPPSGKSAATALTEICWRANPIITQCNFRRLIRPSIFWGSLYRTESEVAASPAASSLTPPSRIALKYSRRAPTTTIEHSSSHGGKDRAVLKCP
jgi:hypothetical protein